MAKKKEIVYGLRYSGSTSIFNCLLNIMNEYDEAKRLYNALRIMHMMLSDNTQYYSDMESDPYNERENFMRKICM